jgi:hypothetical protein
MEQPQFLDLLTCAVTCAITSMKQKQLFLTENTLQFLEERYSDVGYSDSATPNIHNMISWVVNV